MKNTQFITCHQNAIITRFSFPNVYCDVMLSRLGRDAPRGHVVGRAGRRHGGGHAARARRRRQRGQRGRRGQHARPWAQPGHGAVTDAATPTGYTIIINLKCLLIRSLVNFYDDKCYVNTDCNIKATKYNLARIKV